MRRGKTLSAQALAAELGRSPYRVDLATVVSKWLGETEKNLRHAFLSARAVGGVLLFDEGEALMGQRGDVARGSDRYANLEVAYLLQALEAHDGVVVVTTNARTKLDGAFMRRFDVVLELPRPDAPVALIWIDSAAVGPGPAQFDEMLTDLGQPLTDHHIANTPTEVGTACDRIVARVRAIAGL